MRVLKTFFLTLLFFVLSINPVISDSSDPNDIFERAGEAFDNQEHPLALELYSELAEDAHVKSLQNLGEMYYWGAGVKKDEKKAIVLYKRAASGGDDLASYKLGRHYQKCKDYESSFKWYDLAASRGNFEAKMSIANLYENGFLSKDNEEKASKWVEEYKIIDIQNDASFKNITELEKSGDLETAYQKFLSLAWKGHSDSQNKVAEMLLTGRGIDQDPAEAMFWFSKAAQGGNQDAINYLKIIE